MLEAGPVVMTQWYRTADGNHWSIVWTESGRRFAVFANGYTEIASTYMEQDWYRDPSGHWHVLQVRRVQLRAALEYLALDLLPWGENHIHGHFSRRERKGWSRRGENVLAETNILYYLVVQIALRLRRNRGFPQLLTIPYMNQEHTADILLGINGLAWLYHPYLGRRVLEIKCNVVAATIGVAEMWDLPTFRNEYRIDVLADRILNSNGLDDKVIDVHPSVNEIHLHRRQMIQVAERNGTSLIGRALPPPIGRLVFEFL